MKRHLAEDLIDKYHKGLCTAEEKNLVEAGFNRTPGTQGYVVSYFWQAMVPADAEHCPKGFTIDAGTAFLNSKLAARGGDWAEVIRKDYHPGTSPNGTTPESYVKAVRDLIAEAKAKTQPKPDPEPGLSPEPGPAAS